MGVKGHARSAPGVATTNPPLSNEGDSVTQSLDLNGRIRTLSSAYDTQIGRTQRFSPTGAALVESTTKEVGGGFTGGATLDSVLWTAANNGVGSSTSVASGLATITSGTANSGYAYLQSAVMARFHFASANAVRGTWRIPATDGANATRAWGAFNFSSAPTIQSGFYFSYDGTSSTLSVNIANNGSVTSIPSGKFNGDVSLYILDTMAHNYEIIYQIANVFFFVDGVLLHKTKPQGAPFTDNMALSVSSVVSNSASGTVSESLEIWAQSILRLGGIAPSPQFLNINTLSTTVIKRGPGTLHSITVNTAGSTNNIVTLYDNTAGSGTKIATIAASAVSAGLTLTYNCDFQNGLTAVSATGTSADFTVIYD